MTVLVLQTAGMASSILLFLRMGTGRFSGTWLMAWDPWALRLVSKASSARSLSPRVAGGPGCCGSDFEPAARSTPGVSRLPRPGHGRGIRSRGAAGKPRSSSRPEALEARQGGEAAGRALQPGSCGGEIQYHPSGSAARRRVARRAGSLRSALGASSECKASEEEEEEQSRSGSLLGRRVGGGDGRGGGRGLGFFLGAFPVLAAAALAPRRWL